MPNVVGMLTMAFPLREASHFAPSTDTWNLAPETS